jgi:ribonuclease BN (tRNA processing enzyme)
LTEAAHSWLVILGSGTGLATPKRSGPALLVVSDDIRVLIDCGPGTLLRLGAVGLDPTAVDAILLTHLHVDHCSDLAPLLFARRSPELALPESKLLIRGSGVSEHYRRLQELHGTWLDQREGGPVVRELSEPCFEIAPWQVEWARTNHIDSSVAYRFEHSKGGSLVVSGDTGPCDELVELARGADTLVLECSFPDPSPFTTHLSPNAAGELAARTNCRRLVLTHFYPCVETSDIVGGVSSRFSGSIVLAEDLSAIGW